LEERVQKEFNITDKNHDKEISFDEFKDRIVNEFIKPFIIENNFENSLKYAETNIQSIFDRIEIGKIEEGINVENFDDDDQNNDQNNEDVLIL
jgi:hypothetical protein